MLKGTIEFNPSFHGSHRWTFDLSDVGGSVRVRHLCIEEITLGLSADAIRTHLPDLAGLNVDVHTEDSAGIDGMLTHFDVETPSGPLKATIWGLSESKHGDAWRLAKGLWRALYGVAPNSYRTSLEHVLGYLDRTVLPVHRVDERTVRIFGQLSSSDRDALKAMFDTCTPDTRFDLSNLQSMGSSLHPLFKQVDSELPVKSWRVNREAHAHLASTGISPSKLQVVSGPQLQCGFAVAVVSSLGASPEASAQALSKREDAPPNLIKALGTLPFQLPPMREVDAMEAARVLKATGAEVQVRAARVDEFRPH